MNVAPKAVAPKGGKGVGMGKRGIR